MGVTFLSVLLVETEPVNLDSRVMGKMYLFLVKSSLHSTTNSSAFHFTWAWDDLGKKNASLKLCLINITGLSITILNLLSGTKSRII